MLNELEEYLRSLECLVCAETPPSAHPVYHHTLCIVDAKVHSETLESMAGPVKKATSSHVISKLHLKLLEVSGYLRTRLGEFPALTRFSQDVSLEIMLFREFLKELEEMELDASLLSTLSPLLPDHTAREEVTTPSSWPSHRASPPYRVIPVHHAFNRDILVSLELNQTAPEYLTPVWMCRRT